MKKEKRKIKPEEIVKSKPAGLFIKAALAVFILAGLIYLYFTGVKAQRILLLQTPVDSISLPAGAAMNTPEGFTVFRADTPSAAAYSFVKYEEKWTGNVFMKVDMIVAPLEKLGIKEMQIPAADPELSRLVTALKLSFQDKKSEPENTGGDASYEIDYGSFLPVKSTSVNIGDRQWGVLRLEKKDMSETGPVLKTWNNIFTPYKGYLLVIDYVTSKTGQKNSVEILAEIDAAVLSMLEHIHFK